MTRIARITRLSMLVVGFLALQLSALGGGTACLTTASGRASVEQRAEQGSAFVGPDSGRIAAG